ncbi:MAG: dihydrolipoyl dehydrogenase, partial [Candidatus Hecatellales archaeon]
FTLEASKIILASGSRCPDKEKLFPSVSGLLTTDEALELEDLPRSLLLVGGEPSGLELAFIYAELGCEVTVAEMFSQLLPGEDSEIASLLEFSLAQRGLKILTGAKLASLANKNGKVKAVFEDGRAVEAEKVLLAFGRKANVEGLGLEKVGVEVVGGKVQVDAYQQTRVPEIFAVGDVTGGLYAHTALLEGETAAENALGRRVKAERRVVPRCIFTMPEVAAVGLTEEQAKGEGFKVAVGRFPYLFNGRALTRGETQGLVKVVADLQTGRLLGIHIFGAEASELIAEATLALKMGCRVEDLASTIHAHPTLSEALREAALEIQGKKLHKPRRG